MITHFPLVNIIFPFNSATWYNLFYSIATFDIVSTEEIEELLASSVDDLEVEHFKVEEKLG